MIQEYRIWLKYCCKLVVYLLVIALMPLENLKIKYLSYTMFFFFVQKILTGSYLSIHFLSPLLLYLFPLFQFSDQIFRHRFHIQQLFSSLANVLEINRLNQRIQTSRHRVKSILTTMHLTISDLFV